MLYELLTTLSQHASQRAFAVSIVVAGIGFFFWITGARFSRSVFTLVGVAGGALIGVKLPRWLGWEMDAMAFAIGGALVLGLAGYLLHTMWVGMTLGTLLASIAGFVAWHRVGIGEATIPFEAFRASDARSIQSLWMECLSKLPRAIPTAAAAGSAAGGLIAWMWPKLGRVLMFSILGTLMLAAGALAIVSIHRPEMIAKVPASTQTQGVALAILIMLGSAIQWMLLPRARKASLIVSDDSEAGKEEPRPPRSSNLKEARA